MTYVYGADTPPAQYVYDPTPNLNLTSTSYVTLTPEVGVYFVGPTSGRVLITVGGGARDNTNDNRVFMSAQVTRAWDGTVMQAASVGVSGFATPGINADYTYGSRTFLLDGLTRGVEYIAKLLVSVEASPGATADVTSRELIVEPMP